MMTRARHINNETLETRGSYETHHKLSRDRHVACTARETAVRGSRMCWRRYGDMRGWDVIVVSGSS
jgi:hypothetical protein